MRFRKLIALGVIYFGGLAQATAPPAAPKARVSLVPFTSGVAAGQPIEVGVRYELEPGWHIYWQNSGDAGSPPSITWKLPEGFTVGEVQYPAPKKHVSPGDIITNILKGEPVLLATINPPKDLPAGEVPIAAKVVSFVCESQCIEEVANVELKLSVAAAAAEVKPANEEVRSRALRSLPKTASKTVTIAPSVAGGPVVPGSKFDVDLKVEIARGHHIQSDKPTMPSLIPANLFLQRVPGVRFGRAEFPAAKLREDKNLGGKLSEFAGMIAVRVPGEVEASRQPGPMRVGGVFSYQACEDNGNCLPPESLGFSLPVDVVAGAAKAETPVASGISADASQSGTTVTSQATAAAGVDTAGVPDASGIDGVLKRYGLAGLLLGCFLYGLFINATPCVLPLLSIKVLGFVQQAHESRKKTLVLGLAFGAGVVVFFILLGLLASTGRNILQFPIAVIVLGAVVLGLSLSMLGVYTLHVPTSATSLEARIQQEGPAASFAKGALAPVLGFACTGPLLAGIFGWATQQPPQVAILAFAFAGLGMASPYILLGANPGWLSFLPRPGMWMITFERIMGFMLLAMVVWLVHPLAHQIGVTGLEWTLVFYVTIAMACWLLGKIQITMPALERWKFRLSAASLVLGSSALVYGWVYPLDEAATLTAAEREAALTCGATHDGKHVEWQPWSPQAVQETVNAGKIAFVDFTSDYCTICKVNKKIAINTPEFIEKLANLGAVAFQANFTDFNQEIADALMKIKGSNLLPLNLIYPAGRPDRPMVLNTNLTKSYLLQKLDEAQYLTPQSASILGR
jgi:thiol:disulfide interchange protein DsbD